MPLSPTNIRSEWRIELHRAGICAVAEFEAINQRLRYRYALEGFTEEETAAYIKHRLRLSGWDQEFFAPEAIRRIFLASQGIPREINNYCLSALLKAQNQGLNRVDTKLIKQVLDQRELN